MIYLITLLTFLSLGFLVVLYLKNVELKEQLNKSLEENADNLSDQISFQLENFAKTNQLETTKQLNQLQVALYQQLTDIREVLHQNLSDNRDRSDQRLEQINQSLAKAVRDMQDSNEKRLEQMRQTVEEKLEQTLQTRLQASFETVSRQLESVNQGLGEMKNVAKDVGSLNKVLSNTKTRGILGELQLGQIIEDILAANQYEREFPTVSGSSERVEYAIKMPGNHKDEYVYLPIDSKFPLEDYYRLEDAYESGDKEQIESHRRSLMTSIRRFAKDINKKYLNPPETTNFGILFLPTEGLYAEVVRQPAFFDALRREENIVIAGPSTLSALLNSLSVGFRTLNIQKNADDISKILGNVKLEFGKFGDMLAKAQKQLNTAKLAWENRIQKEIDSNQLVLNEKKSAKEKTEESYNNTLQSQLNDKNHVQELVDERRTREETKGNALSNGNQFITNFQILEYSVWQRDKNGNLTDITQLLFLWLVRTLFFIIEILPTIVKIVSPIGSYERMVYAEEQAIKEYVNSGEFKDSIFRIQQLKQNERENAIKCQTEAELNIRNEIAKQIELAQVDVSKTYIDRWKQKELKKIESMHNENSGNLNEV